MLSSLPRSFSSLLGCLAFLILPLVTQSVVEAQTPSGSLTTVRIDGRPDTPGLDPLIDESTFNAVGVISRTNAGGNLAGNINGPSVIRVPDWIPASERVNPNAVYYMYFAHHVGFNIRLAWAESLNGEWRLFNTGNAPDRAWGVNGNNTGTQTPRTGVLSLSSGNTGNNRVESNGGSNQIAANGHIASPDVHVDNVNQRILMYYHAPYTEINGQNTFVATSKYGLNFNATHQGGESGVDLGGNEFGVRAVVPGGGYIRTFIISGQTFAFSNINELWRAPRFNDAGELNTIANADSEGGLWNPSAGFNAVGENWWNSPGLTLFDQSANPLRDFYTSIGEQPNDVRHHSVYTRTHIDPNDTNVYLFYTARNDTPESIFLSVIDTADGSTDTNDWTIDNQTVVLAPELDWEGVNHPLVASQNGAEIGVRQLRDPYLFEDDDGQLYLFYSGAGEEAIGFASIEGFETFVPSEPPVGGEPTEVIVAAWDTFGNVDQNAVNGEITLQPDVSNFSSDSTYSFTGDTLDVRANDRGSNDGTYGSEIFGADNPGANQDQDSLRILQGAPGQERELLVNITAADTLNFSTFHFDAGNNPNPSNGDTYSNVTVSFIDGAGVETILTDGDSRSLLSVPGDGSQSSATGNWLDLDFDASGFSLAAGESGAFRLRFFDTNPFNLAQPTLAAAVHLDNIAITAVEPSATASGDFDGNGVVDCVDLDGYVGNIGTPATGMHAALDIDMDETLTEDDANSTIMNLVVTSNGITGTFPGDFDCNGTVDVLGDAFALIANLGSTVTSYSAGDTNFDGTVDVLSDAFALIANLGNTNTTVP